MSSKRLFTASTLFLFCLVASAQQQVDIDYPYNPDGSEDGTIGSPDLLGLLTLYGAEFEPEGLLVDGIPFNVWVSYVNETLNQQQATIDSLLQLNSISTPDYILCESSDFAFLVSDTIFPSAFDCVVSQYGEINGVGVEGDSIGSYLDSLFLEGFGIGSIRHVVILEEGCNVIDFTKMSEVYDFLNLPSVSYFDTEEKVTLILPNYPAGTRISTISPNQTPNPEFMVMLEEGEYLHGLYSSEIPGYWDWQAGVANYDCANEYLGGLLIGQDIDLDQFGWIEGQFNYYGLPDWDNGVESNGDTFFRHTGILLGGHWIVE